MDARLSPASRVCTDNEDWISVFRQRGVWQLTGDDIKRWVARNTAFFDMLSRLVPRGGKVLELGCGPGRHALGAATLGYSVVGIDIAPEIADQAQANARAAAPDADIEFQVGDMFDLEAVAPRGTFDAITHGGVMEHLASADRIRNTLRQQLAFATTIVFDIPFDSPKNRRLFARDTIFRQLWTAEQWMHDVLAGLPVIESHIEMHQADNMTDDLVVALGR
jgi:2-polyprenyl-3-methyl-5-hydroxy-6-metoxy-1,4-benzoquinol methylase